VLKAQEMILKEMGPDACVYEKVCSAYAEAAALAKKDRRSGNVDKMDWEKIIRYVIQARHVIRTCKVPLSSVAKKHIKYLYI